MSQEKKKKLQKEFMIQQDPAGKKHLVCPLLDLNVQKYLSEKKK